MHWGDVPIRQFLQGGIVIRQEYCSGWERPVKFSWRSSFAPNVYSLSAHDFAPHYTKKIRLENEGRSRKNKPQGAPSPLPMPLRPFASPLCTRRYAVACKQATVVEFILRTFRHSPWFCPDSYSCKADGKQFYGILCICGDSSSQRNPIIPPLTVKKEDSTLTIRRSDLLLNQLGISRFCPTPGIISSSMWKSVWSGFWQNRCGHSSAIERDIQANCWKVWKYAVFELCCILHLYLLSRSSLLWFFAVFSSWDFIVWFCLNELTWYWAICAMRDRIVLEYNKFCQPSILAIRQLTVELTVSRDYCKWQEFVTYEWWTTVLIVYYDA